MRISDWISDVGSSDLGAPVGRFADRHLKVTFCSRPIDRPDWRDIGVQRRKFGDQSPGKATVDIEAVLCFAMRAALGRTRQCRTSNRLWNPSSHARLADIARRSASPPDRQSVVSGQSVAGLVAPGGPRYT